MSACDSGVPRVPIRLTEQVELGEGPHWDECRQILYFVDMTGFAVLTYDPETGRMTKAKVANKEVTLILPIDGQPDRFLIGHDGDLDIIEWDGESDRVKIIKTYVECEPAPDVRLNDGKTSPSGVVFAGSMAKKLADKTVPLGRGNLFVIDTRDGTPKPKKLVDDVDLSNGLAWNPQETLFYWADTLQKKVYKFDYDRIHLSLSNKRVLVDYVKENIKGYPDGLTIDRDGHLWVCCVDGGGAIIRVCSKTGEILEHIPIPGVSDVASVAFGGKDLEDLYITTIKRDDEPLSGCLYVIKDTGTCGYPGVSARIV